jgi:dCMP deaminase
VQPAIANTSEPFWYVSDGSLRPVTTARHPGDPHCNEIGHDLVTTDGRQNCVRTIHAEQNVIAQAAQFGIPVSGATLYVNTFPCWNVCAKLLLGARIGRVIYDSDYNNDERVLSAFQRAGISLEKFDSTLL